MRSPAAIREKIAELRKLIDAAVTAKKPATAHLRREADRARHQVYALQWVIGEHKDERLDWVEAGFEKLGPEAREWFPVLDSQRTR